MKIPMFESGIDSNGIHMDSDKNDLYVLQKCILYYQRHLHKYPCFDTDTLRLFCWILGEDMRLLGNFIQTLMDGNIKATFEEQLSECNLSPDDYAPTLSDMISKGNSVNKRKIFRYVSHLMNEKLQSIGYRGKSEIEKNVMALKKMFGLTDQETTLCEFLFITSTYSTAEAFFMDHLECHKFHGRKYLANILGFSKQQLYKVTYGSPKRIGLYEIDKWGISVEDEFLDLIQNPSDKTISKNFYVDVPKGSVPLEQYFIGKDQTTHILDLLRQKPKTATHILLYGPPGTGKTSFARSLLDRLGVPAYEIVRGEENTTKTRRAAILACLNMTDFDQGSVVLVDEADSLLFSRDRARHSWEISFTNEFLTQMEKFKGVLFCTTNRLDDLDAASLRRFNHKMSFDYLTAVGNLLFYDLFLGPLTNDALEPATREAIKHIPNLAPGDFKVVRDRYSFFPKDDINHRLLIEALEKEAALKVHHNQRKQIGFK